MSAGPTVVFPISVVIPTFNRSATLLRSLKHLENQTWRDFEAIVVDDGSSDGTPERIQEFLTKTTLRLRFVRQPNAGPASARNRGISLVRSPITLMIGDDIFCTPDLVKQHLTLHDEMQDAWVVGLGPTPWDDQAQRVTRFMRSLDPFQFEYPSLRPGESLSWRQFYTSNLSVKTQLLRQNPFCEKFPAAAMEDIELGFRLAQKGPLRVIFLPKAVAYHFHPTTLDKACRRMRKVGWANHLFYELWPHNHLDGKDGTLSRRILRQLLIKTRLLRPVTWVAAVLSRGYLPTSLLHAILNTHSYLGFLDRQAEMAACSGGLPDRDTTTNKPAEGYRE